MAIYHLSAKIISRSAGRSSVAAAAYRSATRMMDERAGVEHDYTRKGYVVHREILTPANTPVWMRDRAALWNAVERIEKRKDAQLARELELALPRELSLDRQVELLRGFVQREFVDAGMIADVNVHHGRARDGNDQPHAHVMLTTRELMGDGFGQKKRDWNSTERFEGWRAAWAHHVNQELEREGHEDRVDHRSLAVQRAEAEREAHRAREVGNAREAERQEQRAAALDREPEPKIGPVASTMEKAGHASRRGDERRAVEARNAERRALYEQAREVAQQIAATAREVVEEGRRRLHAIAERLEAAFRAARARAEAMIRPAPVERPPDPAGVVADVGAVMRDALLGRARPTTMERGDAVDRDRLLGRAKPNRDRGSADQSDDRDR